MLTTPHPTAASLCCGCSGVLAKRAQRYGYSLSIQNWYWLRNERMAWKRDNLVKRRLCWPIENGFVASILEWLGQSSVTVVAHAITSNPTSPPTRRARCGVLRVVLPSFCQASPSPERVSMGDGVDGAGAVKTPSPGTAAAAEGAHFNREKMCWEVLSYMYRE